MGEWGLHSVELLLVEIIGGFTPPHPTPTHHVFVVMLASVMTSGKQVPIMMPEKLLRI